MIKKYGFLFCAIVCITFGMTSFPSHAETAETADVTQNDIAYYDIWLHSDGVTWQKGMSPNSNINATFTVPIASDSNKTITKIWAEPTTNLGDKMNYLTNSVKSSKVTNCTISGNKVTYTVNATLTANIAPRNIKKIDQSKTVEGWRYFIPVKIAWTYTDATTTVGGGGGGGYHSLSCETVGGYSCNFFDGYKVYSTYYPLSLCNGQQRTIIDQYLEYDNGTIIYTYKNGEKINSK